MTRHDKLVQKFRARPADVSFDDVETLLSSFGWNVARQSGNHVTFRNAHGVGIMTVPKVGGQRVKRFYINQICDILGLDDDDGT